MGCVDLALRGGGRVLGFELDRSYPELQAFVHLRVRLDQSESAEVQLEIVDQKCVRLAARRALSAALPTGKRLVGRCVSLRLEHLVGLLEERLASVLAANEAQTGARTVAHALYGFFERLSNSTAFNLCLRHSASALSTARAYLASAQVSRAPELEERQLELGRRFARLHCGLDRCDLLESLADLADLEMALSVDLGHCCGDGCLGLRHGLLMRRTGASPAYCLEIAAGAGDEVLEQTTLTR